MRWNGCRLLWQNKCLHNVSPAPFKSSDMTSAVSLLHIKPLISVLIFTICQPLPNYKHIPFFSLSQFVAVLSTFPSHFPAPCYSACQMPSLDPEASCCYDSWSTPVKNKTVKLHKILTPNLPTFAFQKLLVAPNAMDKLVTNNTHNL